MNQPQPKAALTPLELLARQNEAIEQLTHAVELLEGELRALRSRVEALEGVPLPDEEPPEPG